MKKQTGLVLLCSSATFLTGCGSNNYEPSELHISKEKVAADEPKYASDVPRLVRRTASLPSLEYSETQETFDVIVHNVSVRDLIFALGRDLELNVDVDRRVAGLVSITAFDETFEGILERISRQVPIRHEYVGDTILVMVDEPYIKQYHVEYLNIGRSFTSDSAITGVTGGGESGGSGSSSITNSSEGNFWDTVEEVLEEIVDDSFQISDNAVTTGLDPLAEDAAELEELADAEPDIRDDLEPYFIVDRTTGVIVVYASKSVHDDVQKYLDSVQEIARRQVLLEVTVVEVVLDNSYNQGIDWSVFDEGATNGLFASQGTALGPAVAAVTEETIGVGTIPPGFPGTVLQSGSVRSIANSSGDLFFGSALRIGDLEMAVSLLQTFGTAKVVSSPRVSAMNNQGALMRVVDNRIFFEVESETTDGSDTEPPTISATVTETVVPVGFSMSVLPQISSNGKIMLNLRPSMTRITGVEPIPAVANTPVAGSLPTTSVREFESMLTLNDGEVGVLGGFIEDETLDSRRGIPGAMDIPGVGSLFEHNNELTRRVQLVIFIKASVINDPSITGDYVDYYDLLPDTNFVRRGKGNVLFEPDQKEVD